MMPLLMPELHDKTKTQRDAPPEPLQTHIVLLLKPSLQRPLSPSKSRMSFTEGDIFETCTFDV